MKKLHVFHFLSGMIILVVVVSIILPLILASAMQGIFIGPMYRFSRIGKVPDDFDPVLVSGAFPQNTMGTLGPGTI